MTGKIAALAALLLAVAASPPLGSAAAVEASRESAADSRPNPNALASMLPQQPGVIRPLSLVAVSAPAGDLGRQAVALAQAAPLAARPIEDFPQEAEVRDESARARTTRQGRAGAPGGREDVRAALAAVSQEAASIPDSRLDAIFDGARAHAAAPRGARAVLGGFFHHLNGLARAARPAGAAKPLKTAEPAAPLEPVTGAKLASYGAILAVVAGMAVLHVAPMVLMGLLTFMALDLTHRRISRFVANEHAGKFLSLLLVVAALTGVGYYLAHFTREIVMSLSTIADVAIPRLTELASSRGVTLPFDSLQSLREAIVEALKTHPASLTHMGGEMAKGAFDLFMGALIAVLAFFGHGAKRPAGGNLFDAVSREFSARLRTFQSSFEKVLGAQGIIALINTALTTAFMLVTSAVLHTPFPHMPFLISATLLFSMVPIIGNLVGTALIAAAGLTVSVKLGVSALIFVLALHKTEYFLNSRIVGQRTKTQAFVTILGMMLGEWVFGLPGVVLAPALIHYVRTELEAIPYGKPAAREEKAGSRS